MTPRRIGLGVIGAGRIAQASHLPAATKADLIDLVAIADVSPLLAHEVGRAYGIAAYTNPAELLKQHDVDAVIIAVPDRLHLPLGTEAIKAGRHVLAEKPLAETTAECDQLIRLADEGGLKLQVGCMKRHDPGIEYARNAVREIGPILSMQLWYRVMAKLRPGTEATLFPPIVIDPDVRAKETALKADRERYLLWTHGSHVFDGIRCLAGDIERVSARVAHNGDDFTWHGTGRLAIGGGLVSFEISANVHSGWSEGCDIYGEAGSIHVRSHFPFFRRASDVTVYLESTGAAVSPAFSDTNAYERQLESFARSILEDTQTDPDGRDGRAAVALLEAAASSASNQGREVIL
jgi:predicted dehydrogenase